MRPRHLAGRIFLAPAAGLALALAITACSSSSTPSTNSPSASAASPGSSSGNAAQIKANWEAFFSGKTPAAQKITLLQNGRVFASIIKSQASLGTTTTAQVTSVTLTSAKSATVKYNILQSGAAVLSGQSGVAVFQGGSWKVGDSSFCSLLALEGGGKAPSVCSSAG
ncbi:MAG: hypothetical protein JOY82_06410 [Streptosporangiaceae bacterium]|nr:hypothetical protein [Streptosporangiaceae bacterium]MBV9854143.1 hypothetical protein [Streptosporangiaceae bacterium]